MRDVSAGASIPPPVLPAVWDRIVAAPRRLLMLDYDGTLAPFRVDRLQALPDRRAREALRAVVALGEPVMVVSGRPVAQLVELLGDLPIDLVGEHGWEELSTTGIRHVHGVPAETAERLDLAYRAAAACGWQDRLEHKRASVVLHTRGMPAAEARERERHGHELWEQFFERDGLRLEDINGGLELRATARGKDRAAAEALRQQPAGTLAVYLGDDTADERVFRVLHRVGVTIRVGRPNMPTEAQWRLDTVDDVAAFLEHWLMIVPRESPEKRTGSE